jgi:uncharacterized protein
MEFEWDEGKDAANRAKHGVSLGEVVGMDWHYGVEVVDDRFSYGENRVQRYAFIGLRLFVCVYSLRADTVRIISLRKANKREIRTHGPDAARPFD